jgi:hypothetical protein
MFARTHRNLLFFGHGVFEGFEIRAGMGAVAPGLVLGPATGTPPIGAGFEFK